MIDLIQTTLSLVKPGDLLLDIGANIGGHADLMHAACPENPLHLFEPIPQLATGLQEKYAGHSQIQVFPQGMSDRVFADDGYAVHEAWTLDKPERARRGRNADAVARFGAETFRIDFTTVDTHVTGQSRVVGLLTETGWFSAKSPQARKVPLYVPPQVGAIKLDVDGYELRVLKGARETLRRDRPPLLLEVGYLIEDIGDAIGDFLWTIYDDLHYVLIAQSGQVWPTKFAATEYYPYHTTHDVVMWPQEQALPAGACLP